MIFGSSGSSTSIAVTSAAFITVGSGAGGGNAVQSGVGVYGVNSVDTVHRVPSGQMNALLLLGSTCVPGGTERIVKFIVDVGVSRWSSRSHSSDARTSFRMKASLRDDF